MAESLQFEVDPADVQFRVDSEARTITGLAVPYGKVAKSGFRKWRFLKGSLKWEDVARIKLMRDHDMTQPVGVATELNDTDEGLRPKFKIARGQKGDEVLSLAQDGVLDGLSVGVDFEAEDAFDIDPEDDTVYLVRNAKLREVSITAMPAFDDARVSGVKASRTADRTENGMPDEIPGGTATATAPDFSDAIEKGFTALAEKLVPEGREIVPIAGTRFTVTEPTPYTFDRKGNLLKGSHDFSQDIFAGWRPSGGGDQAARDRAESFVREQFAITPTNVAALNPNRNTPGLYVDQMEYQYPIWEAVQKGTLQDITPFVVPKFSSSSGLVADHVTGTEPTPGAFAATSQTITPSAVSGKVEVTREAYDQGGNPQMSGLIYRQMTRGYYEALEAYVVAQFVANAASIADLTITTAAADSTLDQSITDALVPLQYIRGSDRFRTVFTQVDLYKAMVKAKDSSGRRLYPAVGPQNAVGTVVDGYAALDAHGKRWIPAWALAATSVNAASSYMFDPDKVAAWATPPQKIDLEWRLAWVDIGIWGYKAMAFLDFAGARELVYDPV
jgi:HK97 family phage prohead protease